MNHDLLMEFRKYPRLPMFYLLPREIVDRINLLEFPRNPHEVLRNPHWQEVYNSDYFLLALTDTWAWMMWQFLEIRGGMESYSGYDPFWIMAHALQLWQDLLCKLGATTDKLAACPKDAVIPYCSMDEASIWCENLAKLFWSDTELKMAEVREIVESHRAHEDYDARYSNIKKDFHRHYYHTRSKRVKMVSLEACVEDDEHHIHEIADPSSGFEEGVMAEDFCQRFKERLSPKDMEILELRAQGFTYEKIAEKLGYKGHSGVIKRMQAITKEFVKYEEEQ